MSATDAPAPTDLPFAEAYDRLKAISARLSSDTENEIDPEELLELLADGKGLELALRERLDGVEQRIRQIESGEGIRAYCIVAPRSTGASAFDDADRADDVPVDVNDFATSPPGGGAAAPADDDIPF
jgi:hypothetical protein